MAAILGLDAATVRRACEEAAEGEVVSPANINSPGQVVIAGATAAVQRAGARAKALGAKRVLPLPVSAPFHCALMKPAEERLAPELRALAVQPPRVPIVANVDAEPKRDGGAAIEALVRQVSAPVRWEDVVQRLASEGVTTYVEVGPGRVLSGLVRKIHKDAEVLAFGGPEDLDAILAACSTLRDKVAIVTGASRGIGRAIAADAGGARRAAWSRPRAAITPPGRWRAIGAAGGRGEAAAARRDRRGVGGRAGRRRRSSGTAASTSW